MNRAGPMGAPVADGPLQFTITAVFLYRDILDYTIDKVDG